MFNLQRNLLEIIIINAAFELKIVIEFISLIVTSAGTCKINDWCFKKINRKKSPLFINCMSTRTVRLKTVIFALEHPLVGVNQLKLPIRRVAPLWKLLSAR